MSNIAPIFEINFIPPDTQAPRIKELYPLPNATDVSTKSNVIAYLTDTESGIDINSVIVTINKKEFKIITRNVLNIQYIGTALEANLSILNGNVLQIYLDGVSNVFITFGDVNYSTIQKVCDYIDSLPDYTCSIIDNKYTQYSSVNLLQVTNVDIKTSVTILKLFMPEDNLYFSFIERSDGYIVFANPYFEFENKVPVNVSIDAIDNDGNEMGTFNYIFIPNRLATLSVPKRNYLNEKALIYIKNIQEYIASNYTRSRSTEFYGHHKSIGLELARLEEEFDHINEDANWYTLRPEYLYEKFGYLMEMEPSKNLSHQEYKEQLFSMRDIYFAGSLLESLEKGIAIFTNQQVVIYEMVRLTTDISLQFVIKVDILLGNSRLIDFDLVTLNDNLRKMFDQVKPAHIWLIYGFVWYDFFTRADDVLTSLSIDGRVAGMTHDEYIVQDEVTDTERYEITNHLTEVFKEQQFLLRTNDTANAQILSSSEPFNLANGDQLGIQIEGGVFTVSGIIVPPIIGDKYSNNGSIFEIDYVDSYTSTIAVHRIDGVNNPLPSGTLTRVVGSGDILITFSAFVHNTVNWVTFLSSDFIDITNATAGEVALVLQTAWDLSHFGVNHHLGINVIANSGKVLLYSTHDFQIFDGTGQPNQELNFIESLVTVRSDYVSVLNDKNYVLYPVDLLNPPPKYHYIQDELISMTLVYLDFFDTWDDTPPYFDPSPYFDTWDDGDGLYDEF